MKNVYRKGIFLAVSLFSIHTMAATTGQLTLRNASDVVVPTYQSGDSVYIQVADSDGNTDPSTADSLTVTITSETEDTGTPFSASEPVAGGGNVGDGTLSVLKTSYDTKSEDWTVMAVSANSFLVTGSVSGQQSQQYKIDLEFGPFDYVSDNNEVNFKIENGSVAFAVGDTFSFSTVAGTIVGESITLTETNVDSGVFIGSVALNQASVPTADDGVLDVQSGDLITAFYDDAQGDWGDAEQVRSTALYAATVVKGSTLLADTLWTEANSPYLVTGDVTVSSGVTLTIMPGVKVLFLANSDDTVGGQSSYDSELIIKGSLNVAGTEAKNVTLTSSNREPSIGDWGGIRLEGGSASIAHSTIEYSAYGVDIYNSNNKTITIANSIIRHNGYGIQGNDSYYAQITLTDNTIAYNNSHAIYANYSYANWSLSGNKLNDNGQPVYMRYAYDVSIVDNVITDNSGAIELSSIQGGFVFTGNVVTGNSSHGLYFYNSFSSGSGMTDSIVIEDNIVDDNSGYGIYVQDKGEADPSIQRNKVRNNSYYGIYLSAPSNSVQPLVIDNEITGNGRGEWATYAGLYISGKAVPSIIGNVIDNNGAGVYVSYSDVNGNGGFELSGNTITNNQGYGINVNGYAKPVINGNDIHGNTGYALENHTSFALNVKNNWWGEEATTEINESSNPKALSFIYDGHTNSSAGKVNYAGWLDASYQSGGVPVSDTTTGQLSLTDSSGKVVPTYQSGDSVYIQVADSDGNTDPSTADSLTVTITSETEDTGTPFSASEPVAGGGNVGDGTLSVLKTSYDTKSEDWTVMAVSANSFLVTGSVSGQQSQQYKIDLEFGPFDYVSDNNEVNFKIENGSVAFAVGDTFSFSTVAGTIVGESITLTETNVDSGVFIGSVALNQASVPTADDGVLDVQSGDLITAFYDDAQGDWGDAEQVRSTALYAATVVKGSTLLADTLWTEANSPYLVTGDVTVSSGVTLTIMPGVKVLFLANSDDTVGGQSSYDSELIIKGSLNVAGTEAKNVTLTSSNREPSIGDWGGIRLEGGSASIAHSTIEYSAYGVDIYNSNNKTITIANSIIRHNGYGIQGNDSYYAQITLTDNTIAYNNSHAIYANYSYANWSLSGNKLNDNGQPVYMRYAYDVSIVDNVITDNSGAIELSSIQGGFVFTGNVVTGNSSHGLYFYNSFSSGSGMTDSIVIEDNIVDDNSGYGIYVQDKGEADPSIQRNKVRNNSYYGIYLSAPSNSVQPLVIDNEITGNGRGEWATYAGLYISGKAVPSIIGNVIDNNGAGVYVSYSDVNGNGGFELSGNTITNNQGYGINVNGYAKPVINGNDIHGNTGYALENHTSFALNVKNNWWGEEATTEINESSNPKALSFIYDGHTNSSAGKVNYAGWLDASYQSGGVPVSDTTTGQLSLTDSSGKVVPTYQSGDSVYIQVADSDGNTDPSTADSLTVTITSETEDTGTPFSASEPVAGGGNVGDGTLSVLKTSYDTKSEDWTVMAVSANSFLVTGSVSGQQSQQYKIDLEFGPFDYVSDNNEVNFKIENGSVAFAVGDTFSFSTVAGTIVGESITLTETNVDSGVFIGSVALNQASVPTADDGVLDVQSGDLITAFYDDAQGDWGDAEQVRSTALYAATVVKGSTLLADTLWTEANSPYLVTGDVTVSSGVTLTIMPGVKVLFLANSDDTVGGQSSYDSELIIKGSLNVAGTEAKNVTLTSSNREPSIGDWGGIRLEGGSASIAHSTIEYSAYGVDIYNSNNKTITIANSIIRHNGYGIQGNDSYYAQITLTDNTIAYNNSHAIYANYSYANWSLSGNKLNDNGQPVYMRYAYDVSIVDNVITDNSGAIELSSIQGGFVFTGNVVTGNSSHGLYFYNSFSSGSGMTDSIVIEDNIVDDNSGYGIYVQDKGEADPSIQRNKVRNNSYYGIYLSAPSNSVQPLVIDNEITGNGRGEWATYAGLYISGKAVPSIIGNVIDNNGAGVYVSYSDVNGNGGFELSGNTITNNQGYGINVNGYAKPVINGNDIHGNTGYALENHTSFALNVKNNWWGEEATTEINESSNPKALSFIYDGHDIIGKGRVNYAGWLSFSIKGLDTDSDGIPNSVDLDDDADGTPDLIDAFPLNSAASIDTDLDGLPDRFNDNCNEACIANSGLTLDLDDDNDGVLDSADAYPLIAIGALIDTDGDGAPNECDATCVSLGMTADNDDDNDGISDAEELKIGTNPLLADSDNDGIDDSEELEMGTDPLDPSDCITCGPKSWWRFKLMQPNL